MQKITDKNEIDSDRELQNKIFNDLKVGSLAIIKEETPTGYICELIPQLNNSSITVRTINKYYNIYYDSYSYFDNQATNNDNVYKTYNTRYYEAASVGDIVVILFLDNYTSNKPNKKNNTDDSLSKHSYNNAVVISKIWNDENLSEINNKQNKWVNVRGHNRTKKGE